MNLNRFSEGFSLVDAEDSVFFLPLLASEEIEARIPYISNETGRFIVHLLTEGAKTNDEIVDALEREFDVDRATLIDDVEQFLKSLSEMGVIERD